MQSVPDGPWGLVALAVVFFTVSTLVERAAIYVPGARAVCKAKNLLFFLAEFGLAIWGVSAVLSERGANFLCGCTSSDSKFVQVTLVAFFSKFVQFVDVFLVQASGFPTTTYFRVHHALMPLVMWVIIYYRPSVDVFLVVTNAILHVGVNLFFANPIGQFEQRFVWPYFLFWSAIHLVGVVVMTTMSRVVGFGSSCGCQLDRVGATWELVVGAIYAVFTVMFWMDIRNRNRRKAS